MRRVVDVDWVWFVFAPLEGVERHISTAKLGLAEDVDTVV